jgi:hypothetical protein
MRLSNTSAPNPVIHIAEGSGIGIVVNAMLKLSIAMPWSRPDDECYRRDACGDSPPARVMRRDVIRMVRNPPRIGAHSGLAPAFSHR